MSELENYLASLSEGELHSTGSLQLDFTKLAKKIGQTGGVNPSIPLVMMVMAAVAGRATTVHIALKETALQASFSVPQDWEHSSLEALNQVVLAAIGSNYKSWNLRVPGKHQIDGRGCEVVTQADSGCSPAEVQFRASISARSLTSWLARIPRMDILAKLRYHLHFCNIPVKVNGHLLNRWDCQMFLRASDPRDRWSFQSWEPTSQDDYFPMLQDPHQRALISYQRVEDQTILPSTALRGSLHGTNVELGGISTLLREFQMENPCSWDDYPKILPNSHGGRRGLELKVEPQYQMDSGISAEHSELPALKLKRWVGLIQRATPKIRTAKAEPARFYYLRHGVLLNPIYPSSAPSNYIALVARNKVRLDLLNLRPVQDEIVGSDLDWARKLADRAQNYWPALLGNEAVADPELTHKLWSDKLTEINLVSRFTRSQS